VQDFMNIYKSTGFFGFLFLNQYSHESNEPLKLIDHEMSQFLENFYNDKTISENTILVLFSDHGARFSGLFNFILKLNLIIFF
jgi:membrane-anchored protein YejM (alkaline phosphatase superfamily)